MTIVLICLYVVFIFVTWGFNLIYRFIIDGMFMVVLALDVKITSGTTFHPLVSMLLISS